MARIKRILKVWIPLATAAIILSALIYATVQQSLRQTANDPQIQIALDLSQGLQNGKAPQDLVGQTQVDLSKSLATFVIVFDDSGKPIASQAVLDGRIPLPPSGVFTYTRTNKEDRFTWEPKPGVREAVIVERFEGSRPGFVLVGRSLQEVEKRELKLEWQIGAGLIAALLGSLIMVVLVS